MSPEGVRRHSLFEYSLREKALMQGDVYNLINNLISIAREWLCFTFLYMENKEKNTRRIKGR